MYMHPLITEIKCDECVACMSVCVCAYISACVAAPHDRVLPTVTIKLLQD